MPRSARLRRIARAVLIVLIVLHVAAFYLYEVRARQLRYRALYLDAREQWRNGALSSAAEEFRSLDQGYAAAISPLLLVRPFPTPGSAAFALGRIEAELGHTDSALAAFAESMRVEPGLGRRESRELLLEAHREGTLAEEAREELEHDPNSIDAWRELGAAELGLNDPGAAVKAYEGALKVLPEPEPAPGRTISGERADLEDLLAVARLEAGDRAGAEHTCGALGARETAEARSARLCAAYLAWVSGDEAGARAALNLYRPDRPEQDRLVEALRARLDRAPSG